MMGTLAAVLSVKKIPTPEDRYWAEVEGHIKNVNGVLKVTDIRVKYHLKVQTGKADEARDAFSSYLVKCPAAQSVIGCINIQDELFIDEMD
jgi:organic hydroperoxide reductase OsmC/OhrA